MSNKEEQFDIFTNNTFSGKEGSAPMLEHIGEIKNGRVEIADSGITAGVYSVVKVNEKGIATAGGQILEFGKNVGEGPSNTLAVGGLFFRLIEEVQA